MSLDRLMRRLIPLVIILIGATVLTLSLFGGSNVLFANRAIEVPIIISIQGRNQTVPAGNWITSDTRPVVSGFATAVGSRIILTSNDEPVADNIIAIDHPDFPEPLWEYAFESDLAVGGVYELIASEVLSDDSPVGSSESFYMAILSDTDEIYMPLSLLPEPTLLPTATPVPVLLNGDFELGQQAWTFNSSDLGASVVNNNQSITGLSALIGNPAYANNAVPIGFAEVFQTINVPANGGNLQFNYKIYTHDRIANSNGLLIDTFEVYINRQPTEVERREACTNKDKRNKPVYLNDITILCTGNPDVATQNGPAAIVLGFPAIINLDAYRGESVNLIIRVYNRGDGNFNTWAYIDDFQLVE